MERKEKKEDVVNLLTFWQLIYGDVLIDPSSQLPLEAINSSTTSDISRELVVVSTCSATKTIMREIVLVVWSRCPSYTSCGGLSCLVVVLCAKLVLQIEWSTRDDCFVC